MSTASYINIEQYLSVYAIVENATYKEEDF